MKTENATKIESSAPPSGTPGTNRYLMMMQFLLEGCTSADLARIFELPAGEVARIVSNGLFQAGLRKLKTQQEFELQIGWVGATREAFETARLIMRSGGSESIRLRAAQFLLQAGGSTKLHSSVEPGDGIGEQEQEQEQELISTSILE